MAEDRANPELTLDQVRDAIAEAQGWTFNPKEISHINSMTGEDVLGVWRRDGIFMRSPHHPIPLTLDSAAACLQEGWRWRRLFGEWIAKRDSDRIEVRVIATDDERADRFRLALACIKARKDSHAKP